MKNSKVLLVNFSLASVSTTPFYVMPVGLLSISAYLKNKGLKVDFLDFNVLKKNNGNCSDSVLLSLFEKYVYDNTPILVGASVMVAGQFSLALELFKNLKLKFPDIVTVVGGAHVSQFPEVVLENCKDIDFVVIGEGELQSLVCVEFSVNKKLPDLLPDGLAYRLNDGSVKVIPKSLYVTDINELPYPDYDILNFSDYIHDTKTWHNPFKIDFGVRVPVITSRGCPHLCNFCSVAKCMGQVYRPLSAEKVVDMFQMLIEKYGVRYFAIFDANFAHDYRRVIDICNIIRNRNLKFNLDLPTGLPINSAAKEIVDALASVGLIRTCISVESGDVIIRNSIMKKNVEQDDIFNVVSTIRRYPQIFLLTDFVLGMPEDTKESLEASCNLIDKLDTDDIALSIATPYPGTKLYQQCEKDNLFLFDISKEKIWNSQWYTHANLNKFFIKPYNLNLDELQYYRDKVLALRNPKIIFYQKRMKEVFNIDF